MQESLTKMYRVETKRPFGNTQLQVPPIIFGTSCLGNLYQALPYETKRDMVREWFQYVEPPVVLDTAGKYGAGMALEMMGQTFKDLRVSSAEVLISNKLGWKRIPLKGREPTFEPGAWKDIPHDAEQAISYEGILACWEQGCQLLGADYIPQIVSLHDPDEYLAAATDDNDRKWRLQQIVQAYDGLHELKRSGQVKAVGVGAKDWKVIRELTEAVSLDWIMLACSLTIHTHPPDLLQFVEQLRLQNVAVINSAVFNAGFLIGGSYFDYRIPDAKREPELFRWRARFLALCEQYQVMPSVACVGFGLSPPGVVSVALNSSKPQRVKANVDSVTAHVPPAFWTALKAHALVSPDYPYLG